MKKKMKRFSFLFNDFARAFARANLINVYKSGGGRQGCKDLDGR
jgi:hypothetical protein